ncbi:MAG: ACT domain-containing protein [Nitrospirota bacterium]
MRIKQISVFIGNKKGRLAEVTAVLEQANIDIRALSLAETADFGMLRMIVNDPRTCLQILRENAFAVQETEVIAVEVEDKPGGLHAILKIMDENNINIEYIYAMIEKRKNAAAIIFRVEDNRKAISVLEKHGIGLIDSDSITR